MALNKLPRCLSLANLFGGRKLTCRFSTSSNTACIIIIGDEILKGDVIDTNSQYISAGFYSLGIRVKKISVIADNVDAISREVRDVHQRCTYVVTTGGIGPTHDDVTYEGVGRAFDQPTFEHPDLVKLCAEFFKTNDRRHPGFKLARIPQSARLRYFVDTQTGKKLLYPNVSIGNVYILPGVPHLCRRVFDNLSTSVFESSGQFYLRSVRLNVSEDSIANKLSALVRKFPGVQIGSYPESIEKNYVVRITFESQNELLTNAAYESLLNTIPKENIIA